MATVLYIHANIKPEGASRSKLIGDHFITHYRQLHPEDEIIELDLYQVGIDFLQPTDLAVSAHTHSQAERATSYLRFADQFAQADKYVFATPLWNLGSPAIVKAYFDYVTAAGITFAYTAQGPVGLLKNKKALHIQACGGFYSEGPGAAFEMGNRYVQTICGFLGVTDFQTVMAEGLDAGGDADAIVADAIAKLPITTF